MTQGIIALAVVMPIKDWMHSGTARSILRARLPKGTMFLDKTDCPVEAARNILTEGALRDFPELTHLLFIDDDMVFEPDAFDRLLERDLPIVGGLCHNRRPPYMPILMRHPVRDDPSSGFEFMYDYEAGLVEVDATGCAFLLVKREVFEEIAKTGESPFTQRGLGEDVSFCTRAKEQGYKIFVDTTVEIGHVGEVIVTPDFARRTRDFVIAPWFDRGDSVVGDSAAAPSVAAPKLPCLRGDEVTIEARRARSRYAFAGKEIAKRVRIGEVLDYGCGTGYGCPIIAREALLRGAHVVVGGYDPDPIAIAFGRTACWPMLTLDEANALEGPIAAITCFNVLQHLGMWRPDLVDRVVAGTLGKLIAAAPLVIGSVPMEWAERIDAPGSATVSYYWQRADGSFGLVNDAQDLIFVITR